VILSGRLAEEFLDIYEENLQKYNFITLNIIFCGNKQYHSTKKYANDPFFNPGGIVTDFKEVINYLKSNKICQNNNSPFQFIPDEIETISFAIFLKKFPSLFINDEELENFKKFVSNNYIEDDKKNNIFKTKLNIPYYLYSSIFIRLFDMSNDFYHDINKALISENYHNFKQFIYMLYYGLNRNVFKTVHDKYLYKAINVDLKTYNEIKSKKLLLIKNFQSFTKNREVAENFAKFKKPNLKMILLVVKPLIGKSDIIVTNFDNTGFNFVGEDEVIFLPFSVFEISEDNDDNNQNNNIDNDNGSYEIIYLNYINRYEKDIIDLLDADTKDNKIGKYFKKLSEKSENSIFNKIISKKAITSIREYRNKKIVLWIDQYCHCKIYKEFIKQYSKELKDFYFEKATTIDEAYLILSNYEYKLIYIIINEKLSNDFFSVYEQNIKKIGVVTANIIFCDEESKVKNQYINNPFINPGKIVTNFSKVVQYLKKDECGFENIINLPTTLDPNFTGNNYGFIFKQLVEKQIAEPSKTIKKMIINLPDKKSISDFQNFVYKYGHKKLSEVVNPSQEKKIDLPLYIYPKFFMRLYGLQTKFYSDINKYLSNQENNFGLYETFVKALYYGVSESVLLSTNEIPLYRGSVISVNEFKVLKNNYDSKKNVFYSCKNFLSFSKREEKAKEFLDKSLNSMNSSVYLTKFIIRGFVKKANGNNLMTNAEMRHYSDYPSEKEVLFFPFSSFEIIKIDQETYKRSILKIIELNYVGAQSI